jgi:hypothetical protein
VGMFYAIRWLCATVDTIRTIRDSARSRFEPLHRYWCYRFNGQIPISKHQTDNSHVPQGHSHVPPWQFWHAGAPVRPARTCNTRPFVLMAEQCAGGQAGTSSICICSPAPSAGAGSVSDTLRPRRGELTSAGKRFIEIPTHGSRAIMCATGSCADTILYAGVSNGVSQSRVRTVGKCA